MFPFSNYLGNLNPFQSTPQYMHQNLDFNHSLTPFANYFYFPHPSYYQQNLNYAPFLQNTHLNDISFSDIENFQTNKPEKSDESLLSKNYFQSSKEEKVSNQNPQMSIIKSIQRKDRELLILLYPGNSKPKKIQNQSKYNESEYSAEEEIKKKPYENLHLYLKYRRKNTESNIINRIYSFLTTQFKIKYQLNKLKVTEAQKQAYLKYLLAVGEAWKGPVKRQLLLGLMNVTQSLPAYRVLQKFCQTENVLSLKQFSYLNRSLIHTYLSKIATVSIITSKKMKKSVWKQHLQKVRQLKQYFFEFNNNSF